MKKKEKHDPKLVALASELAKHMKTESDISSLSQILTKLTVETALGAEMEEQLLVAMTMFTLAYWLTTTAIAHKFIR